MSQLGLSEKVLLMQNWQRQRGIKAWLPKMGDIEGEKVSLTLEELAAVHEKKTGALIEFALIAGAY